jgi:hypothetical protein
MFERNLVLYLPVFSQLLPQQETQHARVSYYQNFFSLAILDFHVLRYNSLQLCFEPS